MSEEEEVVYQSKGNKKMEKLIDQFVSWDKNRFSIKAALFVRHHKIHWNGQNQTHQFGHFY
jgi:hypothetical protein